MSYRSGYSVVDFGRMILSEPRMSCFVAALKTAIRPGDVVFDLGSGTGIFALLAAKFGAGHVYAVEGSDEIALLEPLAKTNGLSDRITVVQQLSTDWHPGRQADLIVSDMRGALPLYGHHIPAIIDARTRLLRPGGTLIPLRDRLMVGLAHLPGPYRTTIEPWAQNGYGLDLLHALPHAVNHVQQLECPPESLVSAPAPLAALDYMTIASSDVQGEVALVAAQTGPVHGMLVWFEADLGFGQTYTTSPLDPPLVYSRIFLPFESAVSLQMGDKVRVSVSARLVDGDYVWSWISTFERAGAEGPAPMRQSSFKAQVFAPQTLQRMTSDHVPPVSMAAMADGLVLRLIDGKRSLVEIALELRTAHPDRYATDRAAFDHVAALANRYHGRN